MSPLPTKMARMQTSAKPLCTTTTSQIGLGFKRLVSEIPIAILHAVHKRHGLKLVTGRTEFTRDKVLRSTCYKAMQPFLSASMSDRYGYFGGHLFYLTEAIVFPLRLTGTGRLNSATCQFLLSEYLRSDRAPDAPIQTTEHFGELLIEARVSLSRAPGANNLLRQVFEPLFMTSNRRFRDACDLPKSRNSSFSDSLALNQSTDTPHVSALNTSNSSRIGLDFEAPSASTPSKNHVPSSHLFVPGAKRAYSSGVDSGLSNLEITIDDSLLQLGL